jgi:excisionase family DNA binding protein
MSSSATSTVLEQEASQARESSVKRFLTVDEAAELLRINRKTLYDHVAAESPPWALRFGRTIRISRDGLLRWAGR